MKRCYETKHCQNYSKFTEDPWLEKYEPLKCSEPFEIFKNANTEQETVIQASFRVTHLLSAN